MTIYLIDGMSFFNQLKKLIYSNELVKILFISLLNWYFRSLPVVYLVRCYLSIATTAMTSLTRKLFLSLPESREKFWKIFSPSSTLEQVITWTLWMNNYNYNTSAVSSSLSPLYQLLRQLQPEVWWVTKMLNHQSATPTCPASCILLLRCQFQYNNLLHKYWHL